MPRCSLTRACGNQEMRFSKSAKSKEGIQARCRNPDCSKTVGFKYQSRFFKVFRLPIGIFIKHSYIKPYITLIKKILLIM